MVIGGEHHVAGGVEERVGLLGEQLGAAMLGDEDRRVEMGRAVRAHAVASYAWDDIARRLEEIYVEVAA